MNKEEFIKELEDLKIAITEEKLSKLDVYYEFLNEYNKHTNLTTILEYEDVYLKHFYDSLTISKVIDLNEINNLLDVGTGAGFPGIVLKIFYPKLDVTVLDSNHKKTTFIEELTKKLNIKVNIVNERCENYALNNLNKFAVVVSRAVANMRVISELCLPLVKPNGVFIALKGLMDDTLENSIETITILGAKIVKRTTFNLYNGEGIRNIIMVKKIKETRSENLRAYAKIIKKPLKKALK